MNTIITISREYGAGGTSIGRRVAQELGIEIYDRDIIRNTVLKTGLDAGELMGTLTLLQMCGQIRALPGKVYCIV